MPDEQRDIVFVPQQIRKRANKFKWSDRAEVLQSLLAEPGKVQSVTVTVIGTLVEIAEHWDGATLTLKDETPREPIPKGVPQLQGALPNCVVHIGMDLWLKLKLVVDRETPKLTIEGVCVYDPAIGDVAVYALKAKVSTKKR